MRTPAVLIVLVATTAPAAAAPCSLGADPTLPTCADWMLTTRHQLVASASAGVIASGDSRGGLVTEAARADLGYTLSFGDDIPWYAIDLSIGGTVQRNDGLVSGFGASTRLALRASTVPPPLDERYEHRGSMTGLPIEISHEGQLAALPALSSPIDVARGQYTSQHVEARTAVIRASMLSRDKNDNSLSQADLDVFPVWGSFDATIQDGTRLAASVGGSMMGVDVPTGNHPGRLELLELDQHWLTLADGSPRQWFEIWMLRAEFISPTTGTGFRLGWGEAGGDFVWPGEEHIPPQDHTMFELSAGDFNRVTFQYARHPYITMSGNSAVEDRLSGEAALGTPYHLAIRGFVAHTLQGNDHVDPVRDWTAGVEGTASRRISGLDVGMRAEIGRSFYATLDDGVPTQPGFAARAALSISRSAQKVLAQR